MRQYFLMIQFMLENMKELLIEILHLLVVSEIISDTLQVESKKTDPEAPLKPPSDKIVE